MKGHCEQLGYPLPELWIEPGRSLIAEAGTTIYTVGAQKEVPGVRHFVSVDGGMGDNIRPALYQAVYDGFLANREGHDSVKKVTVVGKYCESGDVLLRDILLPEVKAGIYWPLVVRGLTVIQWQVITTEILDQRWFCRRWTSKISCSP